MMGRAAADPARDSLGKSRTRSSLCQPSQANTASSPIPHSGSPLLAAFVGLSLASSPRRLAPVPARAALQPGLAPATGCLGLAPACSLGDTALCGPDGTAGAPASTLAGERGSGAPGEVPSSPPLCAASMRSAASQLMPRSKCTVCSKAVAPLASSCNNGDPVCSIVCC